MKIFLARKINAGKFTFGNDYMYFFLRFNIPKTPTLDLYEC